MLESSKNLTQPWKYLYISTGGISAASKLLPGLSKVDDVDSINRAAEDIALHAEVNVASAQMGLADLETCKRELRNDGL